MKRFLLSFLALVVVCVIGMLAAPHFIDFSQYKDQALETVETKTGYKLDIAGDFDFSLFPFPRFVAGEITLKAPVGEQEKTVLTLEKLEVNVDLMPLFSGEVAVDSIAFVRPVMTVEAMKDGSLSLITPELSQMSQQGGGTSVAMPSISMDEISIKDGTFVFVDHKTGATTDVRNINTDLSARTLQGPFKAEGSLFYSGYAVNFEMSSEAYDSENKVISPKVKLKLQPSEVEVEYSGIISFEDAVSAQGQTIVRVANIQKLLSDYKIDMKQVKPASFESKGLLTADAKTIDYKNFEASLSGSKLGGSLRVDLAPFQYNLTLKTTDSLALSDLIDGPTPFNKAGFDLIVAGDAAQISLSKSAIFLDGQTYKTSSQFIFGSEKQKPKLISKVAVTEVNIDDLTKEASRTSAQGQSIEQMVTSLAFPISMDIDFAAQKMMWGEYSINDVQLAAKASGNSLSLVHFIGNDKNTNFKISGNVKNLKAGSDIDAYIEFSSDDIQKAVKAFQLNGETLPQSLKKLQVKSKLTGSLASMNVTANVNALNGEIIASGKLASPLNKPTISELILQLKHKSLSDVAQALAGAQINDKNLKGPVDFYAQVSQNGNAYTLSGIKADLSGITVQGDLKANLGGSVPKISGDLVFGDLNLESAVQGSSSASGSQTQVSAKGSAGGSGRWSKEAIDTSALHSADLDLSVKAKRIVYGAWPLEQPSLKIQLNKGALKVSDLKAGLFGGSLEFGASVQSVEKPRQPIYFTSTMKVTETNLEPLATALIGTKLVKVTGKGDLSMDLKSSGASPAALIYDLSGNGVVSGTEIVLDGVDLDRFARALSEENKAGDTVMGLWKGTQKGGSSKFDTLDGAYTVQNGVVQISKMDLDGAKANIQTQGNINLPEWTLATQHTITVKGTEEVPSDVPPFKMTFSGSLDNPAQTFGQGLLKDYLNRKIQRKFNKLLSEKLGVPSNDNAQQAEQGQGEEIEPASGESQTQPQPQEQPQKQPDIEDVAEEALKGVLRDLLR